VAAMTLILRLFQRKKEFAVAIATLMGVRSLFNLVSAPIGGALYTGLGMSGPYTVLGFVFLLVAGLVRFAIGNSAAAGETHRNAPLLTLLKIPSFAAVFFYLLCFFLGVSCLEVIWQPWLGTTDSPLDYKYTPQQVSNVGLTSAAGIFAGAVIFGMPSILLVGNYWTTLIGSMICVISLMFIGNASNPPLIMSFAVPSTPGGADWLPFVVTVCIGIGNGMGICGAPPLMLETLKRESGMPRSETDGAMATILVSAAAAGLCFGPTFGGLVVAAAGAAGGALFAMSLLLVGWLVLMVFCRNYASLKATPDH